MDIASVIGLILVWVLTLGSVFISGASIMLYVSLSSLVLVVFGSFAGAMIGAPMEVTRNVPKLLKICFKNFVYDYKKLISTIVSFSEKARREGILSLEDDVEDLDEPFLKKGIQLAVDGIDPEIIKSILYTDVDQMATRHAIGANYFNFWGEIAPAFGMIGTLLGLIQMLANLSDIGNISSGMSLALITTLYGSLLANSFLLPLRNKMVAKNDKEIMIREIMIEGILSIQGGDNPRMLKMKLVAFLTPKERVGLEAEDSGV